MLKKPVIVGIILLVLISVIIPLVSSSEKNMNYDYVIITTNAIIQGSETLDDFVSHKEIMGFNVLIVTETDFNGLNGQPPNQRAEKIRQWLIENYVDMGIKYVLLIGNPDPDHPVNRRDSVGDIPMKTCMINWNLNLTFYTLFFLKYDYPTDYYYADLTGNWDYDGDGMYGESLHDYKEGKGDGVNFNPEVFVGRIPVYDNNYDDLDHILQKAIDYEIESDNISWRKNVLLPMGFVKIWYDYAKLGEQIIDDVLIPNNFSYWRMYQQGSFLPFIDSQYSSEEELLDGAVSNRWSKENFGIVCWMGHGSATYSYIGTSFFTEGILFGSNDCQYLDDTHPAFTFQVSCSNGEPEVINNLGYSLLKHGAIATVSGSRVTSLEIGEQMGDFSEGFSSGSIAYDYVKYLVEGYSTGESLYLSKMCPEHLDLAVYILYNMYAYNLYGDPSLQLNQNKK